NWTKIKVKRIAVIFKANPARIIWEIVTFPELKTMALGGVATGIIKAQDAEIAADANKGRTSIFNDMPIVISTGSNILAVAVLEVISVKKLILAMIRRVNTVTGRKSK